MTWRAPMRRAAAVAVVAVASGACWGGDDSATQTPLPDVDVVSLDDGATVSLADLEGPAVVNLWATWCAPCRREIPDFEEVHRERGDDVTFVGINIGQEADVAQEFLDDVGATYDQYLDPEGYAVTELQTSTMPVTVVIDADGYISTRNLGPMDVDDLNAAIDDALDG